jgi:hypothetical protein
VRSQCMKSINKTSKIATEAWYLDIWRDL